MNKFITDNIVIFVVGAIVLAGIAIYMVNSVSKPKAPITSTETEE